MSEHDPRDEFEARVRDSLQHDAERIQPADDGLARIRERTGPVTSAALRRRRWLAAGAAGLATAAAVTGGVAVSGDLLDRSADGGPVTPATQTSTSPVTPSPRPSKDVPSKAPSKASSQDGQAPSPTQAETTAPAPAPTKQDTTETTETTEPAPAVEELTVPVYYVGDTSNGPRLFREFHAVRTSDSAAVAALDQMLSQQPFDDDYSTSWADGSRALSVEHSDGLITVDLSAEVQDTDVPRETADLMVQQLVYTATAALQSSDQVRILVEGERVSAIAGSPTGEPLARADKLEVQALTWVIEPVEGATVGRTFTVAGEAAAFEATVSWRLLDGDRVVRKGFDMTTEGMAFSPYGFEIKNVPAGDYTLRVYQQSMQDGSDTFVDDKHITVR